MIPLSLSNLVTVWKAKIKYYNLSYYVMSIPIEIFYIFGYILKISNGKSLSENFWCFHDFYNLSYWVMSILIQRFYIFGYILKISNGKNLSEMFSRLTTILNSEIELSDQENSDIDSNSGNTETLNKTKILFGVPGKDRYFSSNSGCS